MPYTTGTSTKVRSVEKSNPPVKVILSYCICKSTSITTIQDNKQLENGYSQNGLKIKYNEKYIRLYYPD
jgi:hypothetical protein